MGKIRITMLINDLLLGGSQMILLNIVKLIDKERFDVRLCYIYDYGASGRPNVEKEFTGLIPVTNLGQGGKPSLIVAFWRLYRHFRKERPDILQCYLPDSVITGVFAARLAGVKRIIIHEQNTHKFYSRKLEWFFRLARLFVDLTITYSETLEQELFGDYSILQGEVKEIARRSYTIYNGIDLAKVDAVRSSMNTEAKRTELDVRADQTLIFSAARLIEWKGYEFLIRALPKVLANTKDVVVLIAGEGPEEGKLRGLIEEFKLGESVRLIGPRTDVFEILAVTDIYPQAYAYPEGFSSISVGMAGMEGMAFGIPILASRYPALYDHLVDRENLMLVEPRDIDGIADALIYLVNNVEDRHRIGAAARRFVEEYFSSQKTIKTYESIYTALMKRS